MRAHEFIEMVMPPEYLAAEDHDALRKRLEQFFGRDLADSPPIVMQQLKALSAFDATDQLLELAGLPTLVLSAERDIIFRRATEESSRPVYPERGLSRLPAQRTL